MALTDIKIKAIKPIDKLKKYADGGGLALAVTPAGKKTWWFRFRFEGKEQTLTLGEYPLVGLAEARGKLLDAKKELEAGKNPVASGKKAQRKAAAAQAAEGEAVQAGAKMAAQSFSQVAELCLESRENNGLKRVFDARKRLLKHVHPAIGNLPLKDVTTAKILETLLAIRAKGLEEMAKRCRTYISQIFQYAIVRGWAERDPARDLDRLPELRRSTPPEHHAAVKTPSEFGRLLFDIETIKHTPTGAALWLSPYVYVRASELAEARWAEIDWPESLWRIPKKRMKANRPHFVPLARQVRGYLEALHKLTGFMSYIFCGHMRGGAPINPDSMRLTLNRLGYRKIHCHHGFRSVASTFLREQGFNPAWIEAQLAHGESNKVIAAYNHAEYLPQRRDMMQQWADYIDRLRDEAAGGTEAEDRRQLAAPPLETAVGTPQGAAQAATPEPPALH